MVREERRLNPTLPDHLIYARINAEPAMRRHRESFYSNLNAARHSGSTVNHRPVQVARESPLAAEIGKSDDALAELRDRATELRAPQPRLTPRAGFAKAYRL